MSLWNAVGGAVAGAGAGAAQIANEYISQEIQMQKAQVLADIAHANAVKMDKYNLSPERQSLLTNAEANRERAVGAARNETTLAGDVARAKNPDLRQAKIDDTNELARGTAQTRIDVENAIVTGTASAKIKAEAERQAALLPGEIKRAYALADAAGKASARNREAPGAELSAKLAIVEKTLGRPLTEPEKLGLLGLAKAGTGMAERTRKTTSADGLTEETIKDRVPVGGATSGAPPEGSTIYDKAGRKYVVKGGQPVPADAAVPAPKRSLADAASAPPYVPPADSPAAKMLAERAGRSSQAGADRAAERAAESAADAPQRNAAAEAFASIGRNRQAAAALQAGPLFKFLPPDQQAEVFKVSNGR